MAKEKKQKKKGGGIGQTFKENKRTRKAVPCLAA